MPDFIMMIEILESQNVIVYNHVKTHTLTHRITIIKIFNLF